MVIQYMNIKNGTWSILLNNYVEPNATQTGIVGLDIEAEENGTLYILTSDDAVTSVCIT